MTLKKTKKIILSLTVVILAMAIFTGCTLLKENEKRKNNEPLYTISYKGLKETITRREMEDYYAQLGQTYLQYYRWDDEKVYNFLKEQLIKRKAILLEAKLFYGKDKASKISAYDLLDNDEKVYVIKNLNKQYKDIYDKNLKTIIDEKKILNQDKDEKEDTTDIDKKANPTEKEPRKQKEEEKDDSIKYIKNKSLTKNDIPKIWYDTFTPKTADEKTAFNQLKSNIEKGSRSLEFVKNSISETRLISKYNQYKKDKIKITDEEIDVRYKFLLEKERADLKPAQDSVIQSAYEGKIKEGKLTITTPKEQSILVKSILFSFSEEQKKALSIIGQKYGKETEKYYDLREKLALTDEKNIDGTYTDGGIMVLETNEKYDSKIAMSIENKPFVDKEVKYNIILKKISDGIKEAVSKKLKENPELDTIEKEKLIRDTKIEEFDRWIYLVNDDPGMFNNKEKGYMVKISGEDKYVKEYSDLARALFKTSRAPGTFVTSETVGEKGSKIYNENGISFIINDYGIQFIMISKTTVDIRDSQVTAYDRQDKKADVNKDIAYYVVNLDYNINGEGKETVKENIKKTLKEQKQDNNNKKAEQELYDSLNNDKNIKTNDRLVATIKKAIKKDYEAIKANIAKSNQ